MGYPDPGRSDLAVVSKGIGGLTEVSFELGPAAGAAARGAGLVRDALGTVQAGEDPGCRGRPG